MFATFIPIYICLYLYLLDIFNHKNFYPTTGVCSNRWLTVSEEIYPSFTFKVTQYLFVPPFQVYTIYLQGRDKQILSSNL